MAISNEITGPGVRNLLDTVIKNGYCIGCGACAVSRDSPFCIGLNDIGQYEARLISSPSNNDENNMENVCPFSDKSVDEDDLARERYANTCRYHKHAGYFVATFAGYVKEGRFRVSGSSGGFGSWILSELLRLNKVDFVIHVKRAANPSPDGLLFEYNISESLDSVAAGAKSRYYPVELSKVLRVVQEKPGRYAVVGIPCFVKAVRLLQRNDPALAERIRYCVGLVCGHLKSKAFAESLAWQMGIVPQDLKEIDFRVKDPAAPANMYKVAASDGTAMEVRSTFDLFGTDWGIGAFKYKACDYCDDVFAETADITLGDAWLPKYVNDSQGTNVLLVRTQELKQLLVDADKNGRIHLEVLPIGRLVHSQASGVRHRRDAITYRIRFARTLGHWVPHKRLSKGMAPFPGFERGVQEFRIKLREVSHSAFLYARSVGDLNSYIATMKPASDEYKQISADLTGRVISLLRRKFRGIP